jgi:hypothetical protein
MAATSSDDNSRRYKKLALDALEIPDFNLPIFFAEYNFANTKAHVVVGEGSNLTLVSVSRLDERRDILSDLVQISSRINWKMGDYRFAVVCNAKFTHQTAAITNCQPPVDGQTSAQVVIAKLVSLHYIVTWLGESTEITGNNKKIIEYAGELAASDPRCSKYSDSLRDLPQHVSKHIVTQLKLEVVYPVQTKRTWEEKDGSHLLSKAVANPFEGTDFLPKKARKGAGGNV